MSEVISYYCRCWTDLGELRHLCLFGTISCRSFTTGILKAPGPDGCLDCLKEWVVAAAMVKAGIDHDSRETAEPSKHGSLNARHHTTIGSGESMGKTAARACFFHLVFQTGDVGVERETLSKGGRLGMTGMLSVLLLRAAVRC